MTDRFTPVMRALVAASLLLATATLMLVAVNTARAAGALAIGTCGAFGEAYDFRTVDEARKSALAKCRGDTCRVVAITRLRRLGGGFRQCLRRPGLGQGT